MWILSGWSQLVFLSDLVSQGVSGIYLGERTVKYAKLLLIDDLGSETVTTWNRDEILGTILQYRMEENLPTLFTSNLTMLELETHLSTTNKEIDKVKARRIIERIKQLTEEMTLISENKRKQKEV